MTRRRAVRLLPCASMVLAGLGASLSHCGSRVVDAVDLPASPDGGPSSVWPDSNSSANSDPSMIARHDDILSMHPRLLVLDFYNPWNVQQALQRVQTRINAIAESSRYHGYADPAAPAFLQYQVFKIVDLTDHPPPPTWRSDSSTRLPTDSNDAFSVDSLFTQAFAANYGVSDPTAPSKYLNLCQLFERGTINELWLLAADEETPRHPPLFIESKQVYDMQGNPIVGMFDPRTGYSTFTGPHCKVTARIAYVSPTRGVDCDLVPRSIGMENMQRAVPYLNVNGAAFFNDDFRARFGTPFDSWTELVNMGSSSWCTSSDPQTACIRYPSQTSAEGALPDGSRWDIPFFHQGCGSAHFPPNARFEWDYGNTQPVASRCEHYLMGDGAGGSDAQDVYTSNNPAVASYTQRFGDDGCGGGWQVYYRQSMPGYRNGARAVDGSPMKNWWPFLFY